MTLLRIVTTKRMAKKKEPINLMLAEPKKASSKTLAEHLTLTFHNTG